MGRATTTVKTITGKDAAYLKQLGRTGVSTLGQATTLAKLSPERVQKLANSGLVRQTPTTIAGHKHTVVQLTPKGQHYLRVEHGFRSFPGGGGLGHAKHDVKLTELYYKLPEDARETWRHEGDLIQDIYREHPEMQGSLQTCVDATVVLEGQLTAVESIGDSYTGPVMAAKAEIARELLGCKEMISA